jgi:hypothetical protein
MISFWHTQADHNSSKTSLSVNPPDIGLTGRASNFRVTRSSAPSARWPLEHKLRIRNDYVHGTTIESSLPHPNSGG